MQSLNILGLALEGNPDGSTNPTPKLVSSFTDQLGTFIDVLFETNPLDGACDTRIVTSVRPIEVIYDAVSYLPSILHF